MGTSGLDIDKAVTELDTAGSVPLHRCAHFVRVAIEAGGVRLAGYPIDAKDYGPCLTAAGFSTVSANGYVPVKGDVIVIQPYPGGSPAGHIEMYDGVQWVSDYKQPGNDIWPGSFYRKANPAYAIYRP
jgi:type VI secretion system secreted protein VgrG